MKKLLIPLVIVPLLFMGCAGVNVPARSEQFIACLGALAAEGISVAEIVGNGDTESADGVLKIVGEAGTSKLALSTLAACASFVQGVAADAKAAKTPAAPVK